ncbi:NUDIX domain-containing protein [Actinacidiphila sp. bgisy144]|uniref:NUDIX domain-containing protein n=1 Tax=Actinacidiphila sp. bgisy144 TaxID=3413791 RepID=UPI003EBF4DF0
MDHQAFSLLRTPRGVLLVCDPANGGLWRLPGGSVLPGEAPHVAQRRTLVEQTGLTNAHAVDVLVCDYTPPVADFLPATLAMVWDVGMIPDVPPVLVARLDVQVIHPDQLAEYAHQQETRRIRSALAVLRAPYTAPRYRYRGADPEPES